MQEANLEFLNHLTSQSRGPKWAFLQLGLQHLDNGHVIEAVSILRNAIKIDPNDRFLKMLFLLLLEIVYKCIKFFYIIF